MDIGVEISLYPLQADFVPVIHRFLDRLNADGRFRVVSNSMSTQVFGPYDDVLDAVRRELRATFESLEIAGSGKAVFVLKVFGPLAAAPDGDSLADRSVGGRSVVGLASR